LGKSFIRSCLWRFGVKLQHSNRAVSGTPLSSSGREEALKNSLNELIDGHQNQNVTMSIPEEGQFIG